MARRGRYQESRWRRRSYRRLSKPASNISAGLRQIDAVLDENLRDIEIGTEREGDGELQIAVGSRLDTVSLTTSAEAPG